MTTPKKKHRLRNIRLTELSLVDRPANPHARVTLFKRADDDKERDKMRLQTRDEPVSFGSLQEAMAHLQKLHPTTPGHQVMSMAARTFPDLVEKFRADDSRARRAIEKIEKAGSRPEAVVKAINDFDLLVAAIAERDGVSRREAMRRARREHPREFEAYQAT